MERPNDIGPINEINRMILEEARPNPAVTKVSANTYAVTGLGHPGVMRVNAGFVITKKTIIFIDAGFTIADGKFLWNTAHRLGSGCEKCTLILTHHHSDHIFGMRVFREGGSEVIAHARVREFIESDEGRYKKFIIDNYFAGQGDGDRVLGEIDLSLPDRLIERDTNIVIDGEEVCLLATPGHVASELCIHLPGKKVLFAGDAIYEGTSPNTKFAGQNEKMEWICQLRRIRDMDIEMIVPGHGKLCTKDEIDRNISFLERECH